MLSQILNPHEAGNALVMLLVNRVSVGGASCLPLGDQLARLSAN